MQPGPEGRYQLDWEIPPEIYTITRDSIATLAMLKSCLKTLVEISETLHRDTAERRKWCEVLAHYPDFPRRLTGDWWAGPDIPSDHYTQSAFLLYPFFPAEAALTPEDERTAALSLEKSEEHNIERSYADQSGQWHYKRSWAWFFPTIVRLRLGQRTEGWAALHDCLRLFAKPNGLFAHNPVIEVDPAVTEANLNQIPKGRLRHADGTLSPLSEFWCHDAPSAGTLNPNAKRWVTPASEGSAAFLLAATETLLQSHGGTIRVFPCVPARCTGYFSGFLAQGGIEVSASMRHGKIATLSLLAPRACTARLLDPSPCRRTIRPPAGTRVESNQGQRIWHIPLKANQLWMFND